MKIKNIYALDTPFKECYNNLLRYIREESYLPNEVKNFILEKNFLILIQLITCIIRDCFVMERVN